MADNSSQIATWYEVKFSEENGLLTTKHVPLGTGTTLNFAGVEAGEQSTIKCIRIKFSKPIYGLRFWVVNNISGNSGAGGVFDTGWRHGYHIREGKTYTTGTGKEQLTYTSELLNPNDPKLFNSGYYRDPQSISTEEKLKVPCGYDENATIDEYGNKVEDMTSLKNYNSFVPIPQNTSFLTTHSGYYQWGENNKEGNFGATNGTSNIPSDSEEEKLKENKDNWLTPYIYVVVNPPLGTEGGSRTGWGYRISFLYSDQAEK